MMDTAVSPLFDPDIEAILCTLLMTVSLLAGLVIIFVAFLIIRIEYIVPWPWAVVWIPAWIIDGIIFVCIFYIMSKRMKKRKKQKKDGYIHHNRQFNDCLIVIYYILALLFQIFIVVRLDEQVTWSAFQIFIPYFIYEGVQLLLNIPLAAIKCISQILLLSANSSHPEHNNTFSTTVITCLSVLWHQFWIQALRFCLFLLIVLRIQQSIQCSWGIVFIPLYLFALKWALQLGYQYYYYSRRLPQQPEIAQQGKTSVLIGLGVYAISTLLSFILCCASCCLPCFLRVSPATDADLLEAQPFIVVNANKRITAFGESSSSSSEVRSGSSVPTLLMEATTGCIDSLIANSCLARKAS
ncbi:hypothetical protein BDF20DRAFT_811873 [Mycotypha africana]|uniref:uncharacterized protein n=1 Tax=Mycotypha africana TaxID=64632 RepID=UPI002300C003|nr:uncharacterized protein BDF20DRAFT_811873 [Mycotypha africana]KAI8991443.1 hypothetical protein BDF20DRAFT_811873 [Mycotypha africana]